MSNDYDYTQELKNTFEDFSISKNKYYPYYYINSNSNGNERDDCLEINISDTEIKVMNLNKCNGHSGKNLLMRLETFAKKMRIRKISLSDASRIETYTNCSNRRGVDLHFLKIITKGESWYNSLGYVSINFENEKKHNETVVNNAFNNFITTNELLSKSNELFPNIDVKLTIRNYFLEIMKDINNRFDSNIDNMCKKYEFIQSVIWIIGQKLSYNGNLQKIIKSDMGGGRNTKRRRKSRRIRKPKRKGGRKSRKH
jgi:hypothetical protein